jgi:hypothetical protein
MLRFVNKAIREYMKKIGSKGGQKSRRKLSTKQAREMVKARLKKAKLSK